uniref:Nuclear protein MDM1 n=1 Tax=Xenopus tropicalis TaxID=8364 RepID=F7BNK1_XENTR
MPGLSEYDRNYTWKNHEDLEQEPTCSRWAGLRSDELGISKEPRFPSKRRVPYYKAQISKSFQWKEPRDNGYNISESIMEEPVQLRLDLDRESLAEEKLHTPDAPRLSEKANDYAVSSKMVKDVGSTVKKTAIEAPEDNRETVAPSKKVNSQAKANGVHRVLKKKAGLSTAPLQHPLKMSEYRRQFERKTPTENSPMLAAEQVIYNKNKSIPPFNVDALKTETEYKSRFKGSPPAKGPVLRKDWEEKHVPKYEPEDPSIKRKEKRIQINEAICSPPKNDKSETEAKQRIHARKHKEKVIQQLKHSSKSCRRIKSEYTSNFLSPSEYLYKDGAWVRAKKQMHEQDSHLPLGALWVAEINELREKADYYRRREQGTHFSRNHLNQILSVNNKFWDVSSNSSSEEQVSHNIKALDLAGFQAHSKKENVHKSSIEENEDTGTLGISDVPTVPVRRRLVWDENNNSELAQERAALTVEDKNVETTDADVVEDAEEMHAISEEVKRPDRLHSTTTNPSVDGLECISLPSEEGGRLPTPKLKEFGLSQRTHHDRTTPSTGGALLVSPMKEHLHTPEDKKKGYFVSSTPPKKAVCKKDIKTKLIKDKELTGTPNTSPPVAGIRTVDPLPLREDPWPIAYISNTSSPPRVTVPASKSPEPRAYVSMSPLWNTSCRIQGALRDPEFQHNGNFGSPGLHRTAYSDDCSIDDDRLSQISERSAATGSLASQVLERAQRRKEDFWGKK